MIASPSFDTKELVLTTTTLSESVLTRLTSQLTQTLGSQRFALWLGASAQLDFHEDEQALHITVPHRFAADGVVKHCAAALRSALDEAVGPHATVVYHVKPQQFKAPTPLAPSRAATPPLAQRPKPSHRFRRHLDDFILGPSNELAYAAAVRLSDTEADATSLGHPLFLHGGCGLGKTHLLQGICHRLLQQKPSARVRYTTGEQFTNDFIQAIRTNTLEIFRSRIRKLDLLAVDDIHFLAAKEKTQQEFLHTFDQIDLGGARVVLASNCHPKLIKQFSQALVSRCVRGLVVQINPPDIATRRRIVQQLAGRRKLHLPDSAAEVLARRCQGSVRDLEGLVTKLHAMVTLIHPISTGSISRALIERLLDHETPQVSRRPVRFEAILNTVSEYFALGGKQIIGRGRNRHIVLARSVLIHLTRKLTPMSYPEIAAQMGRRNHSTIITAAQRINKQIASDQTFLLPGSDSEISICDLLAEIQRQIQGIRS